MTPKRIKRKERRSALIRLKTSRIPSFLVCARVWSSRLRWAIPNYYIKSYSFLISLPLTTWVSDFTCWEFEALCFENSFLWGGTKLKKRSPPQLVSGVSVNFKIFILSRVIFYMQGYTVREVDAQGYTRRSASTARSKKHFNDFMKLKIKTSVFTS